MRLFINLFIPVVFFTISASAQNKTEINYRNDLNNGEVLSFNGNEKNISGITQIKDSIAIKNNIQSVQENKKSKKDANIKNEDPGTIVLYWILVFVAVLSLLYIMGN